MTTQLLIPQLALLRRTMALRKIRMLSVPFAALIVLVAIIAGVQPKFLSLRALATVSADAAPVLMLVLGASLVILIGAIDLSVATMASFSAVLMVVVNPVLGDGAIAVVLLMAALLGGLQGFVHAKAQIPSFVVSFGMMGILYGLAHVLSNGTAAPLAAPSVLLRWLAGKTWGVPDGILVVAATAAGLTAALRFTRLGRDVFALGSAERAALIAGVRTVRVKVMIFAIASLCAAIAGLMLLAQTRYSSPAMANSYLLPAIVGVVVGGTSISGGVGGIGCAILGGLIAIVIRIGTVMVGLNPAFQNIAFGVVILIAVSITLDREKLGIIK